MFFVKIIEWLLVVKEGFNTLIFYNFEYDAEYGAECNTEPGT